MTREPRLVNGMTSEQLPDRLPWVGSVILMPDGQLGVVQHYEFYHPTQTTFPVKVGAQTSVWSAEGLRTTCEAASARRRKDLAAAARYNWLVERIPLGTTLWKPPQPGRVTSTPSKVKVDAPTLAAAG